MRKILCLTDGFSLGGAERQLIGLASMLKSRGYEVELCSYLRKDFYNGLISECGLKHICLDVKAGKLSKLVAIVKHVKKNNYDWIIAFKDGATLSACFLKVLGLKVKVIVSERNTNQEISRYDKFKFFLYSLADYIVPNSHSQQIFIESNFPRLSNKTVTITNFTDTAYFVPIKDFKGPSSDSVILVVGRIAAQKNILRFLEVVRDLKRSCLSFRVRWYGNVSYGEEDYGEKCRQFVIEHNLGDVFSFFPATNDILSEYQACDVFCLPSTYEGYPNVVCEAMSCGKPILCSNVCDNSYIIKDGVNGLLFDPLNVAEMYNTILKFIKLPSERKRDMGKKSRVIAETSFSEEVFVSKYIELIESK